MRYLFIVLATLLAGWLLVAWSLMLTVGVAHHDWWHVIPLMSYHTALAISFVGTAIGALVGLLSVIYTAALKS
jgi:hypothetical protein